MMQIDNTRRRDWGSLYAPVTLVSLQHPDQMLMLCHRGAESVLFGFGFRANRCGILQTHYRETCPHCWSPPPLRTKVPLGLLTPPRWRMRPYHNKYHSWMKTCRGIRVRRSKWHHSSKEFKDIRSPPTSRLEEAERRCCELKKEMEQLKGEMQHLKNSKETGKGLVPCFLIFAPSSSSLITVGDLRMPQTHTEIAVCQPCTRNHQGSKPRPKKRREFSFSLICE